MKTLSVPLTPELENFVEQTAKEKGLAKTDIVRMALLKYSEDLAVEKILKTQGEPIITQEEFDALTK